MMHIFLFRILPIALLLLTTPTVQATVDCPGDCDGSVDVTVDEIITCLGMALGDLAPDACSRCDTSGDLAVTVDEIVAAVFHALNGCSSPPTATPTATITPTPTVTATIAGMPEDLQAVITVNAVRLTWTLPDPASGNTEVLVLRRLNETAVGPDDPAAAAVYRGSAAETSDDLIHLLPDLPQQARHYVYTVFGCEPAGPCDDAGASVSVAPTLIEVLRRGGYTIYWRHASANVCMDNLALGTADDPVIPDWWRSCDNNCQTAHARQLNATGVAESIDMGNQLRARAVPFDRVLTSEYCRCFRTAELMNLGPEIEYVPALTYFVHDEANRCNDSFDLIAQPPAAGTNTALIGHMVLTPCGVLSQLEWAEAAVFKPDGDGNAELVTRVAVNQWPGMQPTM